MRSLTDNGVRDLYGTARQTRATSSGCSETASTLTGWQPQAKLGDGSTGSQRRPSPRPAALRLPPDRTSRRWGKAQVSRPLSVLFVWLAMILSFAVAAQAAEFDGGDGTAASPYQIATAEQLVAIANDPNLLTKYFTLVADIDLDPNLPGGQVFTHAPIAADDNVYRGSSVAYTGRFYGGGHAIRHLTIEAEGMQYVGLFGRIGTRGRVYDLALEDVRVTAADHAGAMAGFNEGGLTNCSVTGELRVPAGGSWIGGLVGINAGSLLDCRADVTLTAGDGGLMLGVLAGMHRGGMVGCQAAGGLFSGAKSLYLGGLAGACTGGIIRESQATAAVVGGDGSWALGGLAGRADSESVIAGCRADGEVAGGQRSHDLGGLVGTCFGVEVENCHAGGAVTGGDASSCVGGLLGSYVGTAVRNSYATGTVSGFRMLGGFAGRVQTGSEVVDCHAAGRVLRGDKSWGQGGFVGHIDRSDVRIQGCFWDMERSQASASAAGVGLTTAQMQNPQVFRTAGWDLAGDPTDGAADLWLVSGGDSGPQLAIFADPCQVHVLEGVGTSSDPYRIATAEDLGAMGRYSRSAWYRLTADIDLAGITWSAPVVSSFAGVLDGRGHRIRSLTIRCEGRDHVGLFGRIERDAWVYDLGLEGVDVAVSGKSLGAGGLAGENAGYVATCYVTGTLVGDGGSRSLGGVIGANWLGVVTDCWTTAEVRATAGVGQAGGLVGYNYMGAIANCYAAGRVFGEGDSQSGLVGYSSEHAAAGSCYYLAASAGGGPDRGPGVAVSVEQMMQRATFVDWDFGKTWTVCEGKGYPRLRWEQVECGE